MEQPKIGKIEFADVTARPATYQNGARVAPGPLQLPPVDVQSVNVMMHVLAVLERIEAMLVNMNAAQNETCKPVTIDCSTHASGDFAKMVRDAIEKG